MEQLWSSMQLIFVQHRESEKIDLLALEEELVEALNDGMVQLQALACSKYIASNQRFRRSCGIPSTSDIPSSAPSTRQYAPRGWRSRTRAGSGLDPIFIGSADIRVQLPEDSKRLDGIDGVWKEMVKDAVYETKPMTAARVDIETQRVA